MGYFCTPYIKREHVVNGLAHSQPPQAGGVDYVDLQNESNGELVDSPKHSSTTRLIDDASVHYTDINNFGEAEADARGSNYEVWKWNQWYPSI
jgi:hypothetical protein